jgi:hypothetical protein
MCQCAACKMYPDDYRPNFCLGTKPYSKPVVPAVHQQEPALSLTDISTQAELQLQE